MSILIDHCVPGIFLRVLREWGYEANPLKKYINPDADDPDVISLAQLLDAVLLTADMDFSNILNYPPQNYQGIIVIRYQAEQEVKSIATLKSTLDDLYRDELRKVLVVITANRYRVRR